MICARKCNAAQLQAGYREARGRYRVAFVVRHDIRPAGGIYIAFDSAAPESYVPRHTLTGARRVVSDWIKADRIRFRALQLAERAAVRCYQRACAVHGLMDRNTLTAVRPVACAVLQATAAALWQASESTSYVPRAENAAFLVSLMPFGKVTR